MYRDLDEKKQFLAYPIQMKAATGVVFSLHARYERFSKLILVYVWNLGDSAHTTYFALTYEEALQIADGMGWIKQLFGKQVADTRNEVIQRRNRPSDCEICSVPLRWIPKSGLS